MSERLKILFRDWYPALTVLGGLGLGHLYWKRLQETGLGNPNRDYPHKDIIPLFKQYFKEKYFSSEENKAKEKEP